jgi:hypothetical protein
LNKPGNPAQDADLMANLTLLFGFKVVFGNTFAVLDHTYLMDLNLLIDSDEALPWYSRGMLPPEVMERFNLSDKASAIL